MFYGCTHMATVGVKGLKEARRAKSGEQHVGVIGLVLEVQCH